MFQVIPISGNPLGICFFYIELCFNQFLLSIRSAQMVVFIYDLMLFLQMVNAHVMIIVMCFSYVCVAWWHVLSMPNKETAILFELFKCTCQKSLWNLLVVDGSDSLFWIR